jgi:hypothetical protein
MDGDGMESTTVTEVFELMNGSSHVQARHSKSECAKHSSPRKAALAVYNESNASFLSTDALFLEPFFNLSLTSSCLDYQPREDAEYSQPRPQSWLGRPYLGSPTSARTNSVHHTATFSCYNHNPATTMADDKGSSSKSASSDSQEGCGSCCPPSATRS